MVGRTFLGMAVAVAVLAAHVSSGGVSPPDYSKCRKVRRCPNVNGLACKLYVLHTRLSPRLPPCAVRLAWQRRA